MIFCHCFYLRFQLYLPQIVPQMLKVFVHDSSPGRTVTSKVNVLVSTYLYVISLNWQYDLKMFAKLYFFYENYDFKVGN